MAGKKNSHVQYRDNRNGQFIPKKKADRLPDHLTTREHVPNPGHGDTGRSDKK